MNPVTALIITNVIWGAAPPIFKFALTNIPPFTLAFIRFFFASFIFLPFALSSWKHMTKVDLFEICIGAFFGITVNIVFFFIGLPKAPSINVSIIASAGPVFLYFLSVIFLHEKPKTKLFSGMMVALLGVLLIILSPIFFGHQSFVFGEIEGNFFFFLSAIGSVLLLVFYKNVLKRIHAAQVTFVGFMFSSLTFLPFMVKELQTWHFSQLDVHGWLGICFGILFSSGVAYYLQNYGLSKINAEDIGIFTYIDPVVTILVAIPLLGEYPNLYFFLGSLLVFGGIYLAEGRLHWHPLHKLKSQSSNIKA